MDSAFARCGFRCGAPPCRADLAARHGVCDSGRAALARDGAERAEAAQQQPRRGGQRDEGTVSGSSMTERLERRALPAERAHERLVDQRADVVEESPFAGGTERRIRSPNRHMRRCRRSTAPPRGPSARRRRPRCCQVLLRVVQRDRLPKRADVSTRTGSRPKDHRVSEMKNVLCPIENGVTERRGRCRRCRAHSPCAAPRQERHDLESCARSRR